MLTFHNSNNKNLSEQLQFFKILSSQHLWSNYTPTQKWNTWSIHMNDLTTKKDATRQALLMKNECSLL